MTPKVVKIWNFGTYLPLMCKSLEWFLSNLAWAREFLVCCLTPNFTIIYFKMWAYCPKNCQSCIFSINLPLRGNLRVRRKTWTQLIVMLRLFVCTALPVYWHQRDTWQGRRTRWSEVTMACPPSSWLSSAVVRGLSFVTHTIAGTIGKILGGQIVVCWIWRVQ